MRELPAPDRATALAIWSPARITGSDAATGSWKTIPAGGRGPWRSSLSVQADDPARCDVEADVADQHDLLLAGLAAERRTVLCPGLAGSPLTRGDSPEARHPGGSRPAAGQPL